jgi:WD40 repeat protein/serine/threonine protein kinase
MDCPQRRELERFLAGELEAAAANALTLHVEGCASCQSALDELAAAAPAPRHSGLLRVHSERELEPTEEFLDRLSRSLPKASGLYPAPGPTPKKASSGLRSLPRDFAVPAAVPGYEILGELSRGGMGVVYKARQIGLNRLVALKMILAGVHASTSDRARLRAEAEAVARLQHPNIVQIYDIGELEGRPYFTMELISGPTLAQACEGQPQPPFFAAALVETVARAIHCAHQQGILHRDLKPSNVLLAKQKGPSRMREEGQAADFASPVPPSSFTAKVIDFGLARRLDDVRLTQNGMLVGTPIYMAPEQATGKNKALGPGVDVYALGAMLYELLTGQPPFMADSVEATLAIVSREDPIPPRRLQPRVPRDLETICLKCLEKEPARRYASALDLADDLHRFLSHKPVAAQPPSIRYRCGKFARRHKAVVAGLGSTLAALILGTAMSIVFAVGEGRQRRLADDNAGRMEQAQREALWEAYQARLAVAQARLEGHSLRAAAEQLNKAPPALRGWEWRHLHSRLDDSSILFEPPDRLPSTPLFFLPGSARIVVTSKDRKVSLWNAATKTRLRTLANGDAVAVASSATQTFVVVRHEAAEPLFLVDEEGRRRAQIPVLGSFDHYITALSPDGRLLAFGWYSWSNNGLAFFDPSTGATLARLPYSHRGECECLAFSPDGSRLAAGTRGGSVELWDVATHRHTASWVEHSNTVVGVVFSPDSRRLLSASLDHTLRQWDLAAGRVVDVRRGLCSAVSYSPDGRSIATGGLDSTLAIWSADGGEAVSVLCGHTDPITSVTYSADGRWIGTASRDGTVRLWDAASQGDIRVLRGHTSYVYPTAYSPDGRWLASAGWDHTIRLWDAASGTAIAELRGHTTWVAALAITPDGRWLVSAEHRGAIRIWDVTTGRWRKLPVDMHVFDAGLVHRISISPDGNLLALGSDRRVRLFDLKKLEENAVLPLSLGKVRIAVFNNDGTRLAVAGAEPEVQVVRVATGEVAAVLRGHSDIINAIAFSPDGSRILTAGEDRSVRLWDANTGHAKRIMGGAAGGHTDAVFAAVFHPDGTRIATGGRDRAIRIWDTTSGEELIRLAGHKDYVYSLAFSPDGATLASGSGDHTVRLWDTAPLRQRFEARRQLEVLRPQAEDRVEELSRQGLDWGLVAKRLREDSALSEPLRRAAWHAVLRRSLPTK